MVESKNKFWKVVGNISTRNGHGMIGINIDKPQNIPEHVSPRIKIKIATIR